MNSVSENSKILSGTTWTQQNIRQLRLRMGWSRTDMARRMRCSAEEVEMLEEGLKEIDSNLKSELEILLRQADVCSDEVRFAPSAEDKCDRDALQQIEFSRVKDDFER